MIVFISGLSGTGKTTLVDYFKYHPISRWEVFDFDKGIEPVPEDRSKHFEWRKSQTEYWLSIALERVKVGVNTMIIGLCLYPQQIREIAEGRNIDPSSIRYAYLTCNSAERERRLLAQNASHRFGDGKWHEEFFAIMQKDCERQFDTTNKPIEQVAVEIIEWLKCCKECGMRLENSQLFNTLACRNYSACKSAEKEIGSAFSYLMGADDIQDKELEDIGVFVRGKTDSGSRKLEILKNDIPEYVDLIQVKLNNGFWNEIVTDDKIIFIFKHKDGSVKILELSPDTEQAIAGLCQEFNDEPAEKTTNAYKYLSENDFYHDFMLEHYANMINR